MKVLTIGRADASLFMESSGERNRMRMYADIFEQTTIVVFTNRSQAFHSFTTGNLTVIPTRSWIKIAMPFDAYRIARRLAHDVVSAQDPFESGIVAYAVSKRTGSRLHVQIHTDPFTAAFRRESFKNFMRFIVARWLVRRAPSMRVVSQRIKSGVEQIVGAASPQPSIHVLPIMYREEEQLRPHAALSAGAVRVLMVSRLTREKNIFLALCAFARLLEQMPTAQLIIAGDGPLRAQLLRFAETLGITRQVTFAGWVADPGRLFQEADIFLLTSNYEGFGRSVVEALLHGVPVVMTDVGCAGELVRDGINGKIVATNNLSSLSEALITLARNPDTLQMYARASRSIVEQIPDRDTYMRLYAESLQ